MNGYQLTRQWFEWKFNNPGKMSAGHAELYFYIIDRWNYFGQKEEFGLPRVHTMEVLSIGSHNTYKRFVNDLVAYGFIKIIRESSNQYHHSSIIGLSKIDIPFDTPLDTPSDKAPDKASDTIDKLETKEPNKAKLDLSGYGQMAYLVQRWIDYKKSIKDSYKSQQSLDMFFKNLMKYSDGNAQMAEEIIERSMANQWKGIFKPERKNNEHPSEVPAGRSHRLHESFTFTTNQ